LPPTPGSGTCAPSWTSSRSSAALVAHSGGADPALALALDEPERVAALVLIAPGAHDYPWPQDDPYLREFTRLESLGNRGALLEFGLRTWAAYDFGGAGPRRRAAETGLARIARAEFRHAIAAWDKASVLCMTGPPVYERLGEVAAPASVLVGDAEYPMVDRSARDIADRIRGAKVTVVPADHLLPLRAPDDISAAVTRVLASAG
jgi:pimeloyl-ACP methyl ester carboxylesterase